MAVSLSKILMVEDEVEIQEVAKMALELVGEYQVEVCNNGLEALEKAPTYDPDLILMDVMMPGMTGPETLVKLREIDSLSATPLVFMTAKVMESEVAQYRALGALDVISKPFDPMTLAERLQTIWDQHDAGQATGS